MNKKTCLSVILLTTFIDWVGIGLVYPQFSSMVFSSDSAMLAQDTSQATRGMILGFLLAFTSIAEFFFAPVLGVLSDNCGRKKVMLSSLVCGILGYALSFIAAQAESIALFLLSRMIIGVFSSSAGVYGAAIADMSTPQEKAKNFALYSTMSGIGFVVGPFLGGVLAQYSYSIPFLCAAFLTLCNLLLILFYFSETHTVQQKTSVKSAFAFMSLSKLFSYPGLRSIFIAIFLVVFGWSLYWEFIPVSRIAQYGFTIKDLGAIYTYEALFYVISCGLLIRPIVSRFGEERCLFLSMFLLSLFIAILYVDKSPHMLWAYIPVQQFMLALFYPTSTTLVSNMTHHSVQGEVLGIQTSVQSFAFAVAPLIGGLFLSFNIHVPLLLGAASILLGALALACSVPERIFLNLDSKIEDSLP